MSLLCKRDSDYSTYYGCNTFPNTRPGSRSIRIWEYLHCGRPGCCTVVFALTWNHTTDRTKTNTIEYGSAHLNYHTDDCMRSTVTSWSKSMKVTVEQSTRWSTATNKSALYSLPRQAANTLARNLKDLITTRIS